VPRHRVFASARWRRAVQGRRARPGAQQLLLRCGVRCKGSACGPRSTLQEALVPTWSTSRSVDKLLKKVRSNTPPLHYPEFVETFVQNAPDIEAIEFDYYCPKSYLHKERVQMQIKAEWFNARKASTIRRAGARAIKGLAATRATDYVLGWNNRFGQGGHSYLLFLDSDESDEGKVKAALKQRTGWLFKSGVGFHFVSQEISRSRDAWISRLSKVSRSKNLGALVDKKYVDFSIRRGYSTLRMTGSDNKTFVPFMCWDNS